MATAETSPSVDGIDLGLQYRVLNDGCGLLDRSARGRLALTGPGAVEFLNGQTTNELADLRAGEGCYAAFLTHKGKMLGDLRILAVGDDRSEAPAELLLDTERVALQALFDMIRRFKVGYQVELHKRTIETALLSLIGPAAADVLARASEIVGEREESAGAKTRALPDVEHFHRSARIAGRGARLVRTDGPPGVDVLCDAADRDALEGALLLAGAESVSEAAAEIGRVECGRPRYGIDIDENVIPEEAGLNDRAVSFTKGCYVGQETVARLHHRGRPNRHLRGLHLSEAGAGGEQLYLGERAVGRVSSAVVSPRFGPIALALVRREAEPGTILRVGEQARTARLAELPFQAPVAA